MADDANYKPPQDTRWIDIQKRTFTRWANNFLMERMMKIEDLGNDLSDGLLLINLLEVISSKHLPNYNKKPKIRAQMLENTGACLQFLKNEGIKLVAIGPEDITDKNLKLILGLIWTIILRYQIQKISGAGGSAKNDLLEWVRRKIPECNVNDFTSSWQDGRAVCHLTEALKPGCFPHPLNQLVGRPNLENATKGEDVAEKELGIPQILDPADMVAAADELSTMTYISYFRDYEANEGKRRGAEIAARTAEPSKCRAWGPGLEHGETGIPAEFTIQAVNAAGQDITKDVILNGNWEVTVQGPKAAVQPKITDNGNGTYGVVYVPTEVGKHTVSVGLRGKPIQGSPWSVPVDRAPADPTHTKVYGPGLERGVQGEPGVFTIEAHDRLGQRIRTGGDPFQVAVKGPYNRDVDVKVQDNKDGTHTVTYVPIDKGTHTVAVTLNGAHVAKSPYTVQVQAPAGYPDALKCWAEGPGLKGGNTAEPATFTIHAADANGNPVAPKENPFIVDIVQPDGSELPADVRDNRDGTYSVTYQPKAVGPHEITVGLRNPAAPVYYDHIKDSPFRSNIGLGTDASKTLVYGPALEGPVQDNLPTSLNIKAIGTDGTPVTHGGDPFEVKVTGPKGPVPVDLKDNGDGTYTANFAPNDAGDHKIEVTLKNKQVANSPYHINVKEGADHTTSFIEGFQFVIRARTKRNQNMTRGGEAFAVSIQGPAGKVDNKVTDNNNGTYTVNYALPAGTKGAFQFNIKVNGKDIQGSPFTHQH